MLSVSVPPVTPPEIVNPWMAAQSKLGYSDVSSCDTNVVYCELLSFVRSKLAVAKFVDGELSESLMISDVADDPVSVMALSDSIWFVPMPIGMMLFPVGSV